MTRFRPCIDLHEGCVKQIVGGTLSERQAELRTNFVSPNEPAHFARLYQAVCHPLLLSISLSFFPLYLSIYFCHLIFPCFIRLQIITYNCKDGLLGGHVIMLGPGNESAPTSALQV